MKRNLFFFTFIFIFISCAKIPIESVTLTKVISDEGGRMHYLNISLLNEMFNQKREKIDDFIKNEYTPTIIENLRNKIPAGTNLEIELPNILNNIIPEINSRRDKMQSALEDQRVKLISKLEEDYLNFDQAANSLLKLMESSIKVDKERAQLFNQAKEISNNKLDLNKIENSLDSFINNAGNISDNVIQLNDVINSIINK